MVLHTTTTDDCQGRNAFLPIRLVRERMSARQFVAEDPRHGCFRASSQAHAATFPLVQANNGSFVGTLLFDLDRRGALEALRNLDGPPPNFAVASRDTHRAHVGYVLTRPVHLYNGARPGPLHKAAAAERGLANALSPLGNDVAFGKLLTKQPLHPKWITVALCPDPYSLDELIENLPSVPGTATRTTAPTAGLGRNCTIFEDLRKLAYRAAPAYQRDGRTRQQFEGRLLECASGMNLIFPQPLHISELRSISRSIAKWTWSRFSEAKFSALQSHRAGVRWKGHASVEITKPWLEVGISRATWYRQRATSRVECSEVA